VPAELRVPPAQDTPAASPGTPLAVIDTNAWLDLFVFRDPGAAALERALREGAVRAVRSAATDAELLAVLQRPAFAGRCGAERREALLAAWQAASHRLEARHAAPWACRDPDDQKFLDLAHSVAAAWLITKDRALLHLARRARRAGLRIVCPRDFAQDTASVP
jgi:putative PIN family toxin of toxin-antitoxin system